jgi:hypothetical protein
MTLREVMQRAGVSDYSQVVVGATSASGIAGTDPKKLARQKNDPRRPRTGHWARVAKVECNITPDEYLEALRRGAVPTPLDVSA